MNLFDTVTLSRISDRNSKVTEFASFCLTAPDRVEIADYFIHSGNGVPQVMSRREMPCDAARRVYREFQAKGYTRSDVIVVTAAEVAAARSYSNGIFDLAQHVANLLTLADRKAGREAPAYGYSAENFARAEAMIASA